MPLDEGEKIMEKMTLLFPGSFMDYRKVDEDMLEEYLSATETGLFQTILFNYDEWLAGGRLRIRVKEDISNPVVYRGWMLKPYEYKNLASITNLMGWYVTDILLPARIKQLKEKILIIRQSVSLPPYCFDHSVGSFH